VLWNIFAGITMHIFFLLQFVHRLAKLSLEGGDGLAIDYDQRYRSSFSSSVSSWAEENKVSKSAAVVKALASNICPESLISAKVNSKVSNPQVQKRAQSVGYPVRQANTKKNSEKTEQKFCQYGADECPFLKVKKCRFHPGQHVHVNPSQGKVTPEPHALRLKTVKTEGPQHAEKL
jgi:hypothetical protein